jgi:hypothetical protein
LRSRISQRAGTLAALRLRARFRDLHEPELREGFGRDFAGAPHPMTRKETLAEGVDLYLGDCREILPTLGKVDAVVTDPPYGLGAKWAGGKIAWPLHHKNGMGWDEDTEAFVLQLPGLAGDCVIWGGHLYSLPPISGWLIWDKVVRKFTSGHCELAWTTLEQPIRAFSLPTISLITAPKFSKKLIPRKNRLS